MNERALLDTLAIRAVETSDVDREVWSDSDRDWATRTAAETVTAAAPPELFLSRRAALALDRLGSRHPAFRRTVLALAWRPWVGIAIMIVALVAGFASDQIGSAGRINLLAPPMLGLLAWNVAVYSWLAWHALPRTGRARQAEEHPLRRGVTRIAAGMTASMTANSVPALVRALQAFTLSWSGAVSKLYAARATRILHLAAAVFAVGMLAGLYLRGIAFEYRASWESTFLDAQQVHRLLSLVLVPGSALTGIQVPDVQAIAAIRSSDASAGENAARWLHLFAATVLIVVIVPRVGLGLTAAAFERVRMHKLALPRDDPYALRLLRAFQEGPAHVSVLPYSYHVAAASQEGIRRLLERAFAPSADIEFQAPVAYGGEDALPHDGPARGPLVALFNLTATPESGSHGAFAAALARRSPAWPLIAIVDETPYRDRLGEDAARLDARREAWRDVLGAHAVQPVFVDLARPDLATAEKQIGVIVTGASQ